jgi:hypothetical protein
MSEERSTAEHDEEIVHRKLDPERDDPAIGIVEIVADLDDTEPAELTSIWGCLDHVLDEISSNPPASEAQLEITFSYEGYRITVEQNGSAKFVETSE